MWKTQSGQRPRVVIIGGGFGGLNAARALRKAPVEVVLLDRRNYHLFQPLLYQVAMAELSPADIATPIRRVLNRQRNARVLLGEAQSIDPERRRVVLENTELEYDYLILATGATHSYFGHDEWAQAAPGLKTIDDATEIRRRFLLAFEAAEMEGDPAAQQAALTFVVIGGGPTGVELAGAMAEIARTIIPSDFRQIDTRTARVILIEGLPRILPAFPEESSQAAQRQLEQLGVEVRTNTRVTGVDASGVQIGDQRIDAGCILWAAGVQASPLGKSLGVETDRAGRVPVGPDLTLAGHPELFVIGDLATVRDPETGNPVPGVAQGAMQMGVYAAQRIQAEVTASNAGRPAPTRPPFRYKDKGSMATIGRNRAVGVIGRFKVRGFLAWIAWAAIHILFLISFRNRIAVALGWLWDYVFFERGARLITGDSRIRVRRPRPLPSTTPPPANPVAATRTKQPQG